MPVDRTDVPEAEFLEQLPTMQEGLDGLFDAADHLFGRLTDEWQLIEQPGDILLEAVIERGGAGLVEVLGQPTDAGADPHLVVVEDDEHVFVETGGIVERLEHDPRGKGPVADDGHRLAALFGVDQIVSGLEAQHGRDAGPRVPGDEQVINTLCRVRVAHQAPLAADRVELRIAPGHELMRVNLMARVPDQPVLREVEHLMQGDAQLDHAEVAGEVRRAVADDLAQRIADFLGQLDQLGIAHRLEFRRRCDQGQQLVVHQ